MLVPVGDVGDGSEDGRLPWNRLGMAVLSFPAGWAFREEEK